jgi:hypothetical protein
MKLALEALKEINKLSIGENAIYLPAEIDGAMDALRELLAQPEQKPVRFNCTVIDDAHLNGVPLSQWGKQHEMQPCAGRNCGSTNPNLHSAECFEDYEKATGMNQWQGLTDEKKVKRVYFPTSWITPVPLRKR